MGPGVKKCWQCGAVHFESGEWPCVEVTWKTHYIGLFVCCCLEELSGWIHRGLGVILAGAVMEMEAKPPQGDFPFVASGYIPGITSGGFTSSVTSGAGGAGGAGGILRGPPGIPSPELGMSQLRPCFNCSADKIPSIRLRINLLTTATLYFCSVECLEGEWRLPQELIAGAV